MNIFVKKSISHLIESAEGGEYKLKRSLGALNLVSLGIGAIIGAGLFSVTGIAASENAGPAVVLSFVVAAVGCAFAGMCYSELASMIPVAGSAYTYAYATMGEFIAWIIGWDLVLEYAVAAAMVAVSWSRYMGSFLHDFGMTIPAQLAACPFDVITLPDGSQAHGLVNIPAMVIIAIISFLLMLGIKESASVNDVIVLIKLAVVLTFIVVGFHYIKHSNYVPFIPPNTGSFGEFGISGIMRAAGIIFFAYIGPALTGELLKWRRGVEAKFRFDPSKGVDPRDIAALDREIADTKRKLEHNISNGPQALTQIRDHILAQRTALKPLVDEAGKALAQAKVDLNAAS